MATLSQIQANRENARSSTGPRSAAGKAASRLNALKTGIDAKLQVIKGEDASTLKDLTEDYYQRWQPATPEARALVDSLISDEWLLRRLRQAEAQLWDYHLVDDLSAFPEDDHHMLGKVVENASEAFTRLQRRIDSVERNYHRSLKQLQNLPQDSPEIGFVPSSGSAPAPEPQPAAVTVQDSSRKTPTAPAGTQSSPPASPASPPAADCG